MVVDRADERVLEAIPGLEPSEPRKSTSSPAVHPSLDIEASRFARAGLITLDDDRVLWVELTESGAHGTWRSSASSRMG